MSKQHGKSTHVSLNGVNISSYCSSCTYNKLADNHDVTTFGNDVHIYDVGLGDGSATLDGFYETISVTGSPKLTVSPLVGRASPVTLIHGPEGNSTGKPSDTVSVRVTSYTESNPVADMVTWTAELQFTSTIVTGTF